MVVGLRSRARKCAIGLVLLTRLLVACSDGSDNSAARLPPVDVGEYLDRPLRDQVVVMETRQLSSAALTQGYLDRITDRDQGDGGIHAVLALDPDAPSKAASLDTTRGHGAALQGAVILVKDNIDSERLPTTAGSIALAGNVAASDATAIARLRAAGALVLGKTNLSEWANFRGYTATSGWSSAGGQTLNGTNPSYNPCGSSSGSAAAIAAGLASAALGTETDGSVVCPASVNGVVGFKPTVGLVSRTNVVPISHSQDTIGTLTRDVGDAARLVSVMAGTDSADPATSAIPTDLELDFEKPLAAATFAGKRLGVVSPTSFPASVLTVFQREIARIEAAGAVVVPVVLPSPSTYSADELTTLLYEFKPDLEAYLASHAQSGQPSTLAELIAFDDAHSAEVMPYFGQEIFVQSEATTGLDAAEYIAARDRARRTTRDDGIVALLSSNNLDAILEPSGGTAWITDYASGDPPIRSAAPLPAVAGCPHLTVPMGTVGADSLPVGLSIFAGPWDDAKVLALGRAYEMLGP